MSSFDHLQAPAFEALNILMKSGCDFADVYLEETRVSRLKMEESKPDQIVNGGEFGAGLRLVKDELTYFASTNDLTPQGLLAGAKELIQSAQAVVPVTLRDTQHCSQNIQNPLTSVPMEQQIELVGLVDRETRAAGPHVRQVVVSLSGSEARTAIARSDGVWREDERFQLVLNVQAVAAQDQMIQTGYESCGGSRGWDYFQEKDPAQTGRLAGARAERMLSAKPAPSGRMTVVLAGEAGGTMIHEAIGHSLEGDLVRKGLSPFGGKIGTAVASSLVSVVDDATLPGWRGSFGFDDEGTPAQRKILVDRGILQGFMHDLLSSRCLGALPTGNGRRQSYAHRPIPRMTNTMILPGASDPNSILHSVEAGLYVVRMGGGQVNTVNGDFVFEINEGYLIRHGGIAEPIRGATLIGNGPEVLMSIDMVGTDLGMGIGTCGKEGQGAPVADAQPTLRIPEITVGGSA